MLGRAAYHTPAILADVDVRFYGAPAPDADVMDAMIAYIERELAAGERLSHITRHMLGMFHGTRGARAWRRILTVGAVKPGAGIAVVREALTAVQEQPALAVA
jgi:tRNA-dihydrouridine synthase A